MKLKVASPEMKWPTSFRSDDLSEWLLREVAATAQGVEVSLDGGFLVPPEIGRFLDDVLTTPTAVELWVAERARDMTDMDLVILTKVGSEMLLQEGLIAVRNDFIDASKFRSWAEVLSHGYSLIELADDDRLSADEACYE